MKRSKSRNPLQNLLNSRSFKDVSMGRQLPSATQLIFEQLAEMRSFYDALRRSDQLILDKFFEDILQHRAAISNATNLLPIEIMPFVILLEERKKIILIHSDLWKQIEELDGRLRQLEPSTLKKDGQP